ncbi:hypothetical protein IGI04_016973 [Brassica rapa subsp. trilocularis]|uniref:Uncharacterized protein n=1 Tax=Brassica rapa subsp. trilocularis TaxID=1813537 RepID=A0ABQ7MX32_BRACM|nr:hypothetical protein IGI04_016973 [Brassica rapa subsp. trilocularis]
MTEEKASVLCNFCNSSRYGCSSEGQDNEAVREVQRLQLLIRRMNGKDDSMSDLRAAITSKRRLSSTKMKGCANSLPLEEREEKQDHEAPLLKMKREFERRSSEPVHKELERLWLLNERMNGRELEGMTSSDLLLLDTKILLHALVGLRDQQLGPRREQIAREQKEEQDGRCSLDIVKDESHRGDITSRKRSKPALVTVSRKLRRFQNRHRRTMP